MKRAVISLSVAVTLVACGSSRTDRVEHRLTTSLAATGLVSCAAAFNGDISCRSRTAAGGHDDCTVIQARSRHVGGTCNLPGRGAANAAMIGRLLKTMGRVPAIGKPKAVTCRQEPAGETWSCRVQTRTARGYCRVLTRDLRQLAGVYCEQSR